MSSKTITADLPPSSRLTLLSRAAAATATPERSDPVNATPPTRGCASTTADGAAAREHVEEAGGQPGLGGDGARVAAR